MVRLLVDASDAELLQEQAPQVHVDIVDEAEVAQHLAHVHGRRLGDHADARPHRSHVHLAVLRHNKIITKLKKQSGSKVKQEVRFK